MYIKMRGPVYYSIGVNKKPFKFSEESKREIKRSKIVRCHHDNLHGMVRVDGMTRGRIRKLRRGGFKVL